MVVSRTKVFFLSMLWMDICICIYSIPANWKYLKKDPLMIFSEFVFNIIGMLIAIAPFVLLYGYFFVDKDYWFVRTNKRILFLLKISYIFGSACLYVFLINLMKDPKLQMDEILISLGYLFLSGLTVWIIYERYLSPPVEI